MENIMVLADDAGATFKEVGMNDAVIIFTELELAEFVRSVVRSLESSYE